jgi:hypothetical protein
MKKINYIIKFLIVLILSVLFFMCTPAGSGSGGDGSGSSSGGSDDNKKTGFHNTWTNLNPSAPIPIPSGRSDYYMEYVGNNKIIIFGGATGGLNNET